MKKKSKKIQRNIGLIKLVMIMTWMNFLGESPEFDEVRKNPQTGYVRIADGGIAIVDFYFGDWVVIFSDNNIKSYTNEKFNSRFFKLWA